MAQLLDFSRITNKSAIEAAVLIALALSALFIMRQFNHASAAPAGTTHSINVSANSTNTQNPSSSSVTSESTVSSGTTGNNSSAKTNVTVNGQPIAVPQNGSVTKTFRSDNGSTNVNVSQTTSGQTSNNSSSNVQVNVQSVSNSSTKQGSSQ